MKRSFALLLLLAALLLLSSCESAAPQNSTETAAPEETAGTIPAGGGPSIRTDELMTLDELAPEGTE